MIPAVVFQPKSKTHYISTATTISGALLTFAPQTMAFVPVEYYGPIFIGLGVVFHVLRNLTDRSVDQK